MNSSTFSRFFAEGLAGGEPCHIGFLGQHPHQIRVQCSRRLIESQPAVHSQQLIQTDPLAWILRITPFGHLRWLAWIQKPFSDGPSDQGMGDALAHRPANKCHAGLDALGVALGDHPRRSAPPQRRGCVLVRVARSLQRRDPERRSAPAHRSPAVVRRLW